MTRVEPVWIRPDVARAIDRRQIAGRNDAKGIPDEALLGSATRPISCSSSVTTSTSTMTPVALSTAVCCL